MAQSCGSCTVDGPVQIAGPTKVITADTDSAQLMSGSTTIPANGNALVVKGPFVLTDLYGWGVSMGPGSSCPLAAPVAITGYNNFLTGARIFIPAGSIVCGNNGTNGSVSVLWSGFQPY
jgi:hypothetical protein